MNHSDDDQDGLFCSFCGVGRADARFMSTGPKVAICGSCIALCVQEMAEGPGFFRKIEGQPAAPSIEDRTGKKG